MNKLRRDLLGWYGKHRRDLPWRETRDPYRIWVSEVMLQQTRVETVIPYYTRFLDRFPTIHTLADAPSQDVLKLWEGLGYYSRARNLQAAAKEVVERYDSNLPDDPAELQTLPGFGAYTAGAVASIAFGKPTPAVDGNVRRVLSRIFATTEPVDRLAAEAVDPEDPSSFNQALMELGARVCLPKSPTCVVCPVQSLCQAFDRGEVDRFPPKTKTAVPKKVHCTAAVISSRGKVLLMQRPERGRFGGLWEFPTLERSRTQSIAESLRELSGELGVELRGAKKCGTFIHQLSHRTLHVRVLRLQTQGRLKKGKWVPMKIWRDLPFSRLQQRVGEVGLNPKKGSLDSEVRA